MTNKNEIVKAIMHLVRYPRTFAWADMGDKSHLDKMTTAENIEYAQTYAAVLQAIPKYSELHLKYASALKQELGLTFNPRYDYLVKITARCLGGIEDSNSMEKLCLLVERMQSQLSTGKTNLCME